MTVYDEAIKKARIFGCRVAIVHNGNDGPGRVWEAICEANTGGFPSAAEHAIHDIVEPNDPRFQQAAEQ